MRKHTVMVGFAYVVCAIMMATPRLAAVTLSDQEMTLVSGGGADSPKCRIQGTQCNVAQDCSGMEHGDDCWYCCGGHGYNEFCNSIKKKNYTCTQFDDKQWCGDRHNNGTVSCIYNELLHTCQPDTEFCWPPDPPGGGASQGGDCPGKGKSGNWCP